MLGQTSRTTIHKIVETSLILCAVVAGGFNEGTVGTCLPDLAYLTSSSTEQISTLLTWRGVASMLGSVPLCTAVERFDTLTVIGFSLFLEGLFTLLISSSRNLLTMSIARASASFFIGGIEGASMVAIFKIWRDEENVAHTVCQLQMLSFIFGTAVSPMAVTPFLGHTNISTKINSPNSSHSIFVSEGIPNVRYAFILAASLTIFIAGLCLIVRCAYKQNLSQDSDPVSELSCQTKGNKIVFLAYVLFLVFVALFGGLENVMIGLVVTYTNIHLKWTITKAASSVTVFQISRLVVAILSVVVVQYINPFTVMFIDVFFMIAGASIWFIFYKYVNVITWVGIVLIGVGSANVFGTSYGAVDSILPMTGLLAGLINAAFHLGVLAVPPLAGHLLDRTETWSFPLLILISSVLCLLFLTLSYGISRCLTLKHRAATENTMLLK